jgi:hypothetical protein
VLAGGPQHGLVEVDHCDLQWRLFQFEEFFEQAPIPSAKYEDA